MNSKSPSTVSEARAETPSGKAPTERFLPLDAYRGFVMVLLASGGFGFRALINNPDFHWIGVQFDHVPWEGAVFYDIIAPAFVFMVGMAMPFALGRRTERGATFRQNLGHVAIRAFRLLLMSQILISIHDNRLQFQMHDILSQIAVAYFLCFLIMQLPFRWQVVAAGVLLAGHTSLFFLFPGPDGPFTKVNNIGAVWDRALMGYNYASWTTNLDMIPTTVSTLFGVWAGNLIRSNRPRADQLKILVLCMLCGWAGGLALSPYVPIIRKIWTVSLAFYSVGWVIFMFLIFYLLIEVAGYRKFTFPFIVAGSNAILLYSLDKILRGWLEKSVGVFTGNFTFLGVLAPVAQRSAVLLVMWYLCYWLYRRKIFLRL